MILWTDAVTDRTSADVERVKALYQKGYEQFTDAEKQEWIAGMKGALNTSDLLRIQQNINLLSEVLELGFQLDIANIAFPTTGIFEELLEDVEIIRNSYSRHATTPNTPISPLNTFDKWNDIEKILVDVHEILLNNFHYYTGDIYAGDTVGLLL